MTEEEELDYTTDKGGSTVVEAVVIDGPHEHESGDNGAVEEDPLRRPEDPKTAASVSYPSPYTNGNFIEVVLGTGLALSAVASVLAIDLSAAIVYLLECGFCQVSNSFKRLGGFFAPFYALFIMIVYVLMFVDMTLLAVSVLVAEILAVNTWLVTMLFGGCQQAAIWHQYVRRMCHLTRWALRFDLGEWAPARVFPGHCCESSSWDNRQGDVEVSSPTDGTLPEESLAVEAVVDADDKYVIL